MKIKGLDRNEVYGLEEIKKDAIKFEMLKKWLLENTEYYIGHLKDLDNYPCIKYMDYLNKWVISSKEPTKCALTLFELDITDYQVDCTDLSKEQIEEMAEVVKGRGMIVWENENALKVTEIYKHFVIHGNICSVWLKYGNKTTITYDKFMELFAEPKYEVKYIAEQPNEVFNPQQHYFNEPKQFRSLFELSHVLELNDWEFDILKRLVRCRKKGQFKEDLKKIKDTVDIYLNEYEN